MYEAGNEVEAGSSLKGDDATRMEVETKFNVPEVETVAENDRSVGVLGDAGGIIDDTDCSGEVAKAFFRYLPDALDRLEELNGKWDERQVDDEFQQLKVPEKAEFMKRLKQHLHKSSEKLTC